MSVFNKLYISTMFSLKAQFQSLKATLLNPFEIALAPNNNLSRLINCTSKQIKIPIPISTRSGKGQFCSFFWSELFSKYGILTVWYIYLFRKIFKIFEFCTRNLTSNFFANDKCVNYLRFAHFQSTNLSKVGKCVKSCDIDFSKWQFCDMA